MPMTDEEMNEKIKALSEVLQADDVRHLIVGIHRANKMMCLRMFANDAEVVNMILTILNYNQRAWDMLFEKMSQLEAIKMHMISKEGGNT